jgi:aminoglycoside 3-N-acetyltransferase I
MTDLPLIRRLTPDDIELCRAWLNMFGAAFEDEDAYGKAQPDDAYLRDLLADPTFIALAALAGDGAGDGASNQTGDGAEHQ